MKIRCALGIIGTIFLFQVFVHGQAKTLEVINLQAYQGDTVVVKINPQWQGSGVCVSAFERQYIPNKDGYVFIGVSARLTPAKYDVFRTECWRGIRLDSAPSGEIEVFRKIFKKTRTAGTGPSSRPRKQSELDAINNTFSSARILALDITNSGKYTEPVSYAQQMSYPIIIRPQITHSFGFIYKNNSRLFHSGVDMRMTIGTPIKAVNMGQIVLVANNFSKEGNMVIINHGRGIFSVYMHLSKIDVQEGKMIFRGQIIGLSGDSGTAQGNPHLHFNIRINDLYVDPLVFMDTVNQYLY